MDAVVLDLFGTLVAAPTPTDRRAAATRLARIVGCETDAVERYFLVSWQARHDGRLPTVATLARQLVCHVGGAAAAVDHVTAELQTLARRRLTPDPTVVATLRSLRRKGYRVGVLSDASADIAEAWPTSPLATAVDVAVFSCVAGCTKPDQRLYSDIINALAGVDQTLYCGDGGGDELFGALRAGLRAVGVRRRGGVGTLAFGQTAWEGPLIECVEQLPSYLAGQG